METEIRALNAVLMIVLPLALGACLARRYRVPWSHLALSVLVLQVFVRGRVRWLVVAIGWHALLDGVSVYGSGHLGAPALEGVLACFGVASAAIVFALRPPLVAASGGH